MTHVPYRVLFSWERRILHSNFHQAICDKIKQTIQQSQGTQYGQRFESFQKQKSFIISTQIQPLPYVELEIVVPD